MELDDQLAALAAGELDDADARALEARASSEPALGARLARFRRLEALLRDGSGPVAMDPEAVRRLDATFDEALDALPDGPLLGTPAAAAAAAAVGDAEVVDLAARRARRRPRWVAGAAAAAAVLAGVVVVGPNLVGGSDDSGEDTMAMDSAEDEAATEEQQLDEDAAGSAEAAPGADALADDGDGADDSTAGEATEEDAPEQDASDDATGLDLPVVPHDDTAAALLDRAEVETALEGVADPVERRERQEVALDSSGDDPLARCVATALELEPGSAAVLLAVGVLDGVEIVHVVLTTEAGGVLAVTFDAADCTVLDRAER